MTETIEYTWTQLSDDVMWLGKAIALKGKPDRIVGIVRGGAIPGIMLSHMLGVPFVPITWCLRDNAETDRDLWKTIRSDAEHGTKTLVVEDIIDSGSTIRSLWQWARKSEIDNIQVATLWYNTAQLPRPDYFARTIDRNVDDRWVIFPYELEPCECR